MKKITFLWIVVLALAISFSFSACDDEKGGKDNKVKKTVVSIAITAGPNKTVYMVGEDLVLTGLVVTATYDDDSSETVTGFSTSGYDKTIQGKNIITVTYKEKTADFSVIVTNAINDGTLFMMNINGGTFSMGTPSEIIAVTETRERPVRQVTVSDFHMSIFEVTQAQYKSVMSGADPSQFKGDNLPVTNVSWFDAVEFCNALSVKDGFTPAYNIDKNVADTNNTSSDTQNGGIKWTVTLVNGANGYRLPTEAEWEYACRAGTTTLFNTGDTITTDQANWGQSSAETPVGPVAVGSYAPNNWGLYDMHGNVQEWCWDFIMSGNSDDYYSQSNNTDNPLGRLSGDRRAGRGGHWNTDSNNRVRSAYRERSHGNRNNYDDAGIRVVRSIIASSNKNVVSIAITAGTNKTVYMVNEELNLTGLVVTATYDDDSSETVTGFSTSGYDKTIPGKNIITVTYKEKTAVFSVIVTNAINDGTLFMMNINGGTFSMGTSSEIVAVTETRERPVRQVTVNDFHMSIFEVTQAQYKSVMSGADPSQFKGDNLPVTNVSWFDAVEFCNALSVKDGFTPAYNIDKNTPDANNTSTDTNNGGIKWTVTLVNGANGYRLPTEAEWEYACRAETTTLFNTGDTIATEQANWGKVFSGPVAVGNYVPNPWGLYDMHGNVNEWCWDFIMSGNNDDYYSQTNNTDNPLGRESGDRRVGRGGNWNTDSNNSLRSAYRERSHGNRNNYNDTGIRVVRSIIVHDEKTLVSISITSGPEKTIYKIGEELELSGLVVTAAFNDDSQETVTSYITSGFDKTKTGKNTITVTYENMTAIFFVTVAIDDGTLFMMDLEGGTFTMGTSSEITTVTETRERPVRQVTVNGFYMSIFEVTQAQYREVMGNLPSGLTADNLKGDNLPVIFVSWFDAVEFCNALSLKDGFTPAYIIDKDTADANNTSADSQNSGIKWTVTLIPDASGYRLPTEAEWEYACRAGTTTLFNTGDTITTAQANWGRLFTGPVAVGNYASNPWGLYDMHGNVNEWCWDFIMSGNDDNYYSQSNNTDNPLGRLSGDRRVGRGGNWNTDSNNSLRSAYRERSHGNRNSYNDTGIRVVRSK